MPANPQKTQEHKMKTDIILAGVGGQGILTIATILGRAALNCRLNLKQAEVHGMSQRGGDVQSNLRISSSPIHSDLIPTGGADLIVSMEPMEALCYLPFLSPEGKIITNSVPFKNIDNYPEEELIIKQIKELQGSVIFDMDAVARECGSARSSNIVLLGAAMNYIEIPIEEVENAITALFERKGEKVLQANLDAFRTGLKLGKR